MTTQDAALLPMTKTAKFDGDRRVHELAPITINGAKTAVAIQTLCGLEAGPARPGWGVASCADCRKGGEPR